MNEPLYPAQLQAIEKLKGLRVGALYMERQEGKLHTVSELVNWRLESGRIDEVLWLCAHRRVEMLTERLREDAPQVWRHTVLCGCESLSHNLPLFEELMERARVRRVMLVIDNGLLIKNPRALRTQRVLALSRRCRYRLLVSDLPFTCSVRDMFSQWYALDWRILGYRTYWGFCINHLRNGKKESNLGYLARAIAPYCAQIMRADVQSVAGRKEYVWRFRQTQAVMAEYQRVMDRFVWSASFSTVGVYRMLLACQQVASGCRIIRDYPLKTEPFFDYSLENPRMQALLEVLCRFPEQRILVQCRFQFEMNMIYEALRSRYGEHEVAKYPFRIRPELLRRITVMNCAANERETARLRAEVIIYYSSDWDWQKHEEKERQCRNALKGRELIVVSLAAADTIDMKIIKCIWKKENLLRLMQAELSRQRQQRRAEE